MKILVLFLLLNFSANAFANQNKFLNFGTINCEDEGLFLQVIKAEDKIILSLALGDTSRYDFDYIKFGNGETKAILKGKVVSPENVENNSNRSSNNNSNNNSLLNAFLGGNVNIDADEKSNIRLFTVNFEANTLQIAYNYYGSSSQNFITVEVDSEASARMRITSDGEVLEDYDQCSRFVDFNGGVDNYQEINQ